MNYNPKVILSGRNLNDEMVSKVILRIEKLAKKKKIYLKNSKVLIMGLTFKENCPDIRNSLSFRLVDKLSKITFATHTYDPWIEKTNLKKNSVVLEKSAFFTPPKYRK